MNLRDRYQASILLAILLASPLWAQSSADKSPTISGVGGESWLTHLNRNFDDTSMGKTGRLGPPEPKEAGDLGLVQISWRESVTLRGEDLYRLNCRGCHGESGLGAPPEINSVINPVRSGSAPLILALMKRRGMSLSRAEAAQLARQSQDSLRKRLHDGGQDMPAFSHLSQNEIRALVAYLNQLADVPGPQSTQLSVSATQMRVGELLVKSTCHICHSAAGPNPDARAMEAGAIPPLSALPSRVSRAEFIAKVTRGAPVRMGDPQQWFRGRMPVFFYLSAQEASDAYDYLTRYRPLPSVDVSPTEIASAVGNSSGVTLRTAAVGSDLTAANNEQTKDRIGKWIGWALGTWAAFLMLAGTAFTLYEVRRAVAQGPVRRELDLEDAATAVLRDEDPPPTQGRRSIAA